MPIQRSYNVWKTGIILTVKKYKNIYKVSDEEVPFPWCVVAISKTFWERDKLVVPIKILGFYRTNKEAQDAIPEIQNTINKHKFPR